MGKILENLHLTLGLGLVLALVLIFGLHGDIGPVLNETVLRWLHVFAGIVWIGLLYYFNFVQIPTMPSIPDEQKPAIGKHIAPKALFWFRWGAMSTIATGLILATLNYYIIHALTLGATSGAAGHTAIGIGMWLGTIMWFNVWFVIWPNQQKALNIANRYPDIAADEKAKAARTAMLFSRTNTVLSVPMLFAMVAAQGLFSLS